MKDLGFVEFSEIEKVISYNITWSHTIPQESEYETQEDWNQTILTRINQISAQMSKDTQVNGATTVVCSSDTFYNILKDLMFFYKDEEQFGDYQKMGLINNRFTTYLHKDCPDDKVYVLKTNGEPLGGVVTIS